MWGEAAARANDLEVRNPQVSQVVSVDQFQQHDEKVEIK